LVGSNQVSVISKLEPEYTPEAKAEKIEGTTALRLVIDQNVIAQKIQVVRFAR
jgi:hypothetical protein